MQDDSLHGDVGQGDVGIDALSGEFDLVGAPSGD